jgi:DNA-binding NtrC family response regulator
MAAMKRILLISRPWAAQMFRGIFAGKDFLAIEEVGWDQVNPGTKPMTPPSLVIAVLQPSDPDLTVPLSRASAVAPGCPCLAVLPAEASSELVQAAARLASDFVIQPFSAAELYSRVGRYITECRDNTAEARQNVAEVACLRHFVTRDAKFQAVLNDIRKLSRTNAPVLIVGETGTGKELCARALHHLSARTHGPFIPVDCPALPDHLFENELFGHMRGAFTDAHHDQKGLVALARGGTLFLDEVDSLTAVAQGKLLRFLQDRVYRPLGSERFLPAETTVLAASNRDLQSSMESGQFRRDLYFRLNVLRVDLTPLRDRLEDIELLADHFITEYTPPGEPRPTLPAGVAEAMRNYDWPGNVRELINVIRRAVTLADGGEIQMVHLGIDGRSAEAGAGQAGFRKARAEAVERFERRYIAELLKENYGNVTHAARAAGKERRAFGRLMKKYGISYTALTR